MLYYVTKDDLLPGLAPIQGLEVRESDDPELLSVIGQIPLVESRSRMAHNHKAYVAYWHGVPAAFGWMAMGSARIGELNHEFILPGGHRYLWNFRTLAEFRGRGIYPHLLQGIITLERQKSDCFWIMHAPENRASGRGILKAGFKAVGQVSVMARGGVMFEGSGTTFDLRNVWSTFGFTASTIPPASCWNCSSPFMKNKTAACCCTAQQQECNSQLFLTA